MIFTNKLCQNILKYNNSSHLSVSDDGTIDSMRYYCTTADLLNNSTFIRYGSIGDGSCLLHAIYTASPDYISLDKEDKELFIMGKREQLASEIQTMSIDDLFKYFSIQIWYIIMDGDDFMLPQFPYSLLKQIVIEESDEESDEESEEESEEESGGESGGEFGNEGEEEFYDDWDYDSDFEMQTQDLMELDSNKISEIWQKAVMQIDRLAELKFSLIQKIIIDTFTKDLKDYTNLPLFLTKLKDQLMCGIKRMRQYYYEKIGNVSNWLGAPEYLFLCDKLDANFFILRFDQYGVVLGQELGEQYSAFINPQRQNNYIISWNENPGHYELVSVKHQKNFKFANPIIQVLIKLASTSPRDICKKYPLLSMFYNDNPYSLNMPCQFLYPIKVLDQSIPIAKAMIQFTKELVAKISKKENQYITKCLQFIIKKYNKILTQSFSTLKQSEFWTDMTKKNIGQCFSHSKDLVRLGSYTIEVSRNGEQLAVACLDVMSTAELRARLNLSADIKLTLHKNVGYIFNLCVPARHRRQGYCKLLMKEIHYLLRLTHNKKSRRSRIKKKSLRRKNPFTANTVHINKHIRTFYLEVYADNLAAIKCYKSIKFKTLANYDKNNKSVFLLKLS